MTRHNESQVFGTGQRCSETTLWFQVALRRSEVHKELVEAGSTLKTRRRVTHDMF